MIMNKIIITILKQHDFFSRQGVIFMYKIQFYIFFLCLQHGKNNHWKFLIHVKSEKFVRMHVFSFWEKLNFSINGQTHQNIRAHFRNNKVLTIFYFFEKFFLYHQSRVIITLHLIYYIIYDLIIIIM